MAISFANVHVLDPSRAARRLLWHVLSIGYVSRDEPENHSGMDKADCFSVGSSRAGAHLPTRRVVEAVQADPLRDWQAAELSALAGIGYSTLRSRFKASHGETLHEYLQRTRLEQARSRLTDMQFTVKEIALQLNFSSEFYFSRWFHKSAGMSPSRFRALIRG